MIPLARVVHALPGRKRIRIDEKRGDEEYFATVKKKLADCPGVLAVEANFLTASVLLHHHVDDPDVWRYATEQELFNFSNNHLDAPVAARSLTRSAASGAKASKRIQPAVSNDHFNWRPLIFLGLAALGISQAVEGNIAVPAVTAFWYALNALPWTSNASNGERRFLEAEPPGEL